MDEHEIDPTQALIDALIPDLPLLMYGSGDVHPTQVDPATTELIATLTAEYVEKLVKAAIDAHDCLTDGAGGLLPPPSFQKKKEDDWSHSLPVPKIKDASTSTSIFDAAFNETEQEQEGEYIKGVDLYANRIRSTHSSIPSTLGAQSFIFPICHDAEIYNKVKGNERFKADVDSVLIDSTMMDFIREEEEGFDHLASSVFHWVHTSPAHAGEVQVEEGKISNERMVARRKEMARRLTARTGLDVQVPGVEDILLPIHSTEDHLL